MNAQQTPFAVIGGGVIVAVIFTACLVMALFLHHGLPVGTLPEERMAFIAAHPRAWSLGWVPWMASALGLLLFCTWLADYAPSSGARSVGITLVAIGVAPDIAAELIYAVVLPAVVAQGNVAIFHTFELLATALTGVLANGAYCLGGLVLNTALLRNPQLPRPLVIAGLPAWVVGLGLSVAVYNGAMQAAAVLTGVSMALSLAWMLAVTVVIFRFPSRYRCRV